MALIKYPYTNLHELNLDWIIEQLNNQDGPVRSVNGKSGFVVLTGEDLARSTSNPQTIADAFQSQGSALQSVQNKLGTTALPTTAQTVTGAIAEHETDITNINNKIGSTALPTIAQTLTGGIAENAGEIADIDDAIGSTALPTTAQTLTGAIAEVDGDITGINNKIGTTPLPTTAQTLTGAIAEHESDLTTVSGQIASKVSILVATENNVSLTAGEHKNVTVAFTSPGNVQAVVVLQTPNSAYIFGSAVAWSASDATIGLYNTATSVVTGNLVIGVLYK